MAAPPPTDGSAVPPDSSQAPAGKDAPGARRPGLPWVSSTYFGEGLPWSFIHQMGMEFLTSIGATKTQISSTSLMHLAVTLKFIWSPLVDLFGRRRTWVIVTQIILGFAMFAVAGVSSRRPLTAFWIVLGGLAIVHATHDIACDGFYLQALNQKDRALYSGVRNAAYRLAMWLGRSPLVVLAGVTSWTLGFGAAGVVMLIVAGVNALLMPHASEHHATDGPAREAEGDRPVKSKGAAFFEAYRSFIAQPQAVLVLSFMFMLRLGDIMMFAMSSPLLNDIGIGTAKRGLLSTASMFSFIVSSLIGGAWIARRGLERTLIPMTFIQNLAIPLYIGIAVFKPGVWGVLPVIVAEQFANGIGNAGYTVFLMQRCRSAFSAAHYAFATALVSVASTLSGFASGPLNDALGHPLFFALTFVISWPSLILVFFVPKTPIEPGP